MNGHEDEYEEPPTYDELYEKLEAIKDAEFKLICIDILMHHWAHWVPHGPARPEDVMVGQPVYALPLTTGKTGVFPLHPIPVDTVVVDEWPLLLIQPSASVNTVRAIIE